MKQEVTGPSAQRFFAMFEDPDVPAMAPLDQVAAFESELDAINYSVDQALANRRGLTHMQLADDMRITRAVFSKLRQGQVGMPAGKLLAFVRATSSVALVQFYAMRLKMVLKPREQELADQKRIAYLEEQLRDMEIKYSRVVGLD